MVDSLHNIITIIYDAFNRLSGSTTYIQNGNTNSVIASENYTYKVENGKETALIDKYNVTVGLNQSKYRFEYDSHGNITAIYNNSNNTLRVSYVYDNLNRLTRENNKELNKTYVYTYDNAGNITSKKTYAFTTSTTLGSVQSTKTYTYGNSNWGDQLTAYNYASITYDASGNPLIYNNGSSYTFAWTAGRRLATATKGTTSLSFKYNESGIRTTKTVGTVVHEYILDGTKIVAEKWGVSGVTHLVEYIYDANSVIGMIYHNNTMSVDSFEQYVFEKNLQGDIVAVYNASGTLCVKYTYDAWGNVATSYYNGGASTGAQYNSFRYRGYYYDTETGLYYLNSRYYDPAVGRFINADIYINANGDLTGFNMYAYCSNNPVMYCDCNGTCIHNNSLYGKDCPNCQAGIETSGSVVTPPKNQEFESCGEGIGVANFAVSNSFDFMKPLAKWIYSCEPRPNNIAQRVFNKKIAEQCLDAYNVIDATSWVFDGFFIFVNSAVTYEDGIAHGASPKKIAHDIGVDIVITGLSTATTELLCAAIFPNPITTPALIGCALIGLGCSLAEYIFADCMGGREYLKGMYK